MSSKVRLFRRSSLALLEAHQGPVTGLAFSADGKTLASAGVHGPARLWDVASGKHLKTLTHTDWVLTVSVSRDGRTLISGSRDQTANRRSHRVIRPGGWTRRARPRPPTPANSEGPSGKRFSR